MLFPSSRSRVRRLHESCFQRWGLGAKELTAGDLDEAAIGWELRWPTGVCVHYRLGVEAPYATPAIRIVEPAEAFAGWRNVELDGTVCFLPPGAGTMPLLHPKAVDRVLRALARIIESNLRAEELPPDPVAARHRWVGDSPHAWSLLDLDATGEIAVASRLGGRWVVAGAARDLEAWRQHLGAPATKLADALVVRVQEFANVPSSLGQFSADARGILEGGGLIVFVVAADPEPLLVAVALDATGAPVRLRVDRADRGWVHERGGGGFSAEVAGAHVTLVGCGSLGSGVAELLARAGVGRLTLVDPDSLSWDNVARHALGGSAVGQPKATQLASRLCSHLPTTPHVNGLPLRWQVVAAEQPDALSTNILISTMAAWPDDLALSEWARLRGVPFIVGWLEPRAVAGHAVSLQGQCLGCHFTPAGRFRGAVAVWDENPVQLADGCHEQYYPYGYADVVPVQSLIARLALECLTGESTDPTHRAIVPSRDGLNAVRAVPSTETAEWLAALPPTIAWAEQRRSWDRDPRCWHCGNERC